MLFMAWSLSFFVFFKFKNDLPSVKRFFHRSKIQSKANLIKKEVEGAFR